MNNTNNFLKGQLDLYRQIKMGEKTWDDMNCFREVFGLPKMCVDSLRRSFKGLQGYDEAGWITPKEVDNSLLPKETIEYDYKNGVTNCSKNLFLDSSEIKDGNKLLIAHGFNPNEFELISAKNSSWEQSSKDGLKTLYSSKISVKPKTGISKYIEDIKKDLQDYKPNSYRLKFSNSPSKEVLVLPLYDFHWGRLPDYDTQSIPEEGRYSGCFTLKDYKESLLSNLDEYIERLKNRKFETVYLIIGQDYFNSSFTGYTSSQSHLQSNAVDVRTMYTTGTELMIDIIDKFSILCNNMKIIGSLGNHDTQEEIWLFNYIKAYYRKEENIEVDDSSKPRKYLNLGASCVGVGHLDKEKDRAFGLMQCEAPWLWAKASTRMFLAGHLHHFSVESKQGVEVWRVPAPTPPDRWSVENGYVQNIPKTMGFIFDLEKGLIETHFVNM